MRTAIAGALCLSSSRCVLEVVNCRLGYFTYEFYSTTFVIVAISVQVEPSQNFVFVFPISLGFDDIYFFVFCFPAH